MSKETETPETVTGCLFGWALIPLAYYLKAWALVMLWGWFITPQFHIAVPPKSIALGLAIIYGLLAYSPSIKRSSDKFYVQMIATCLAPTFSVGIGWLIHNYA